MIKVGIKYCGGCRCLYDRQERLRQIRTLAGTECEFAYVRAGAEYDVLLVISGCTAQCADISSVSAQRIVSVIPQTTAESVVYSLLEAH